MSRSYGFYPYQTRKAKKKKICFQTAPEKNSASRTVTNVTALQLLQLQLAKWINAQRLKKEKRDNNNIII